MLFVLGSLLGLLGVAAGAFGAHGLKGRLDVDALQIYETAVRYQLFHSIAILVAVLGSHRFSPGYCWAAGGLFVAGSVIFSGSLYALSLTGIRWLGAITPIGGLAFLVGWVCLGLAALFGSGRS